MGVILWPFIYKIMKINNNRVVEATELELFDRFVAQEYYYFMSFKRYLELVQENGCKIIRTNNYELLTKKVKLVLSLPLKLLGAQLKYLWVKRK